MVSAEAVGGGGGKEKLGGRSGGNGHGNGAGGGASVGKGVESGVGKSGAKGKKVTAYTRQQWLWMKDRIVSERCLPYQAHP